MELASILVKSAIRYLNAHPLTEADKAQTQNVWGESWPERSLPVRERKEV